MAIPEIRRIFRSDSPCVRPLYGHSLDIDSLWRAHPFDDTADTRTQRCDCHQTCTPTRNPRAASFYDIGLSEANALERTLTDSIADRTGPGPDRAVALAISCFAKGRLRNKAESQHSHRFGQIPIGPVNPPDLCLPSHTNRSGIILLSTKLHNCARRDDSSSQLRYGVRNRGQGWCARRNFNSLRVGRQFSSHGHLCV